MHISLQQVTKRFNQEVIFKNLSLDIQQPQSLAILGKNGIGKSTLLKLIAGFSTPNEGKVAYTHNTKNIKEDQLFEHISFVAPYSSVVDEMTLAEFFEFHFSFKNNILPIDDIIEYIGLSKSKNKIIEDFSSGMKQRVKLAQAIFSDTTVLLLDEPCSNLDTDGIALYHKMIHDYCKHKIIVVASNDMQEYSFCNTQLFIQDYK